MPHHFKPTSPPPKQMRRLFVNAGPLAHLSEGVEGEPLVGHEMMDYEQLISPLGLGILLNGETIEKIADSDSLLEEYSSGIKPSGGTVEMISQSNDIEIWNLAGKAVIPGLVDSHNHLIWAGDRSNEIELRRQGYTYQDIAKMGGGITKTVTATRKASVETLLLEGKRRLQLAKSLGTTFCESKSGYGLSTEAELKILDVSNQLSGYYGVLTTSTWLGAHDVPKGYSRSQYVEELLANQLPAVIEQDIANYVDVFCEDGWFTVEETEVICNEASKLGLSIRLHVDEFSDSGGAELAAEIGALSADHAGWSSDDARAACNENGVIQTFLPGTPYVLGLDHWPPFEMCIKNEWAWALASDFNPNCHSLSLPFTASLAVHRNGVSPLAALVGSTRNSAASLTEGKCGGLGTLVEGGPASFNVLWGEEVDGWCTTPGQTPFVLTMANGVL